MTSIKLDVKKYNLYQGGISNRMKKISGIELTFPTFFNKLNILFKKHLPLKKLKKLQRI